MSNPFSILPSANPNAAKTPWGTSTAAPKPATFVPFPASSQPQGAVGYGDGGYGDGPYGGGTTDVSASKTTWTKVTTK